MMEWISVEDRLPGSEELQLLDRVESKQIFLIFHGGRIHSGDLFAEGESGKYYLDCDEPGCPPGIRSRPVTHWILVTSPNPKLD